MKISPSLAAIIAALIVAALVAFVLRPSQLTVHPEPAPTITRTADPDRPAPVRVRPRPLVYVAGAVVHPGVYDVADDARARDAIARAGGMTHDADPVAVNLAAHVADGDEIAVPRLGDAPARGAVHLRRGGSRRGHRHARPHPAGEASVAQLDSLSDPGPVDLNTADVQQLSVHHSP